VSLAIKLSGVREELQTRLSLRMSITGGAGFVFSPASDGFRLEKYCHSLGVVFFVCSVVKYARGRFSLLVNLRF